MMDIGEEEEKEKKEKKERNKSGDILSKNIHVYDRRFSIYILILISRKECLLSLIYVNKGSWSKLPLQ
jgi:hypothetical protein